MFASERRLPVAVLLAALLAACGSERPTVRTSSAGGAAAPAPPQPAAPTTAVAASGAAAPVTVSYADGEAAYRAGQYRDAESLFAAYTTSKPENVWGQYMLGLSAWKAGDLDRASAAFDAALALDSTHLKSLLNSARVDLERNRPADARERIARALAVDSTSGDALRLLARALDQAGETDSAVAVYHELLVRNEQDVWAMNNLGVIRIESGDYDAAIPPLARATQVRPGSPVFQNNLGTALEGAGYLASARDAYAAALQADSGYHKAAVSLERVSGLIGHEASDTVDLGAEAQTFVTAIRMWKDRPEVVLPDTD